MPARWTACVRFVFRSKVRFTACYFGTATGIWLMVAAYFLQASVDFEPLSALNSSKYRILKEADPELTKVMLPYIPQLPLF